MTCAKRLSILALAFILVLAAAGCSDLVDPDRYLEKEILTLADMEKLFAEEGFSLTKVDEGAVSLMLQVRNATVFYIHKTSSRKLDVYVFDTKEQREAARAEFDRLEAFAGTIEHQVYEAKNILVILWAGALTNADYDNVGEAMLLASTS
ncbi:MAG: hypothetical protein KBA30_11430 [Clostridia bacterium]|nr:hypothetical protein [Clostridia bacterium]